MLFFADDMMLLALLNSDFRVALRWFGRYCDLPIPSGWDENPHLWGHLGMSRLGKRLGRTQNTLDNLQFLCGLETPLHLPREAVGHDWDKKVFCLWNCCPYDADLDKWVKRMMKFFIQARFRWVRWVAADSNNSCWLSIPALLCFVIYSLFLVCNFLYLCIYLCFSLQFCSVVASLCMFHSLFEPFIWCGCNINKKLSSENPSLTFRKYSKCHEHIDFETLDNVTWTPILNV